MHGIPDSSSYARRKLNSFYKIHSVHELNFHLPKPRASNLYALLYAKYFSQREIITAFHGEDCSDENDEQIKELFKAMLKESYTSPRAFENRYLKVIQEIKSNEIYNHYLDLNNKMEKNMITQEETKAFVDACVDTEVFLENKLRNDIKVFLPPEEKFILFLKNYQFINGWITSVGVAALATMLALFQK